MNASEVCEDKDIPQMNRCKIGFQHGKKKMKMEDNLAAGPLGRDYGDGYKVGRELAFKQTLVRTEVPALDLNVTPFAISHFLITSVPSE